MSAFRSDELVGVIMAGGAGTRFWPASTEQRPKQFLTLFGERSLLQQSYDRLAGLIPPERVLVLTSADFAPLVQMQLPELPPENVIAEPMRRDTAAAVTLAATLCAERFNDPIMTILTSDHLIGPTERFQHALVSAATGAASGDALYTFGIRPDEPATGFGYLELGASAGEHGGLAHRELTRFVEKPDLATAKEYLAAGNYLWNSGMFVWRSSAVLAEIERQLPAHAAALRAAVAADGTPAFDAALRHAFEPLEKVSIDFGVMEHARSVRCVEPDFAWSDVGSFLALADHLPTDDSGNAHRGRLFGVEAQDNIVFTEDDDEVVGILGLSDLVVVRAGRRTLIAPRERAEDIKKLVSTLDDDVR